MFSIVHSGGLDGIQSYVANVEVDSSPGLPGYNMVGRLASEVKEARERVRVCLRNCGIAIPPVQITINISPANINKYGTAFDLPIAIGILNSLGQIPNDSLSDILIVGELSLDGKVRGINGILPIILAAKNEGFDRCMVPLGNYSEARYVEDIEVIPVDDFVTAVAILQGEDTGTAIPDMDSLCGKTDETEIPDFADIIGQSACKRAALIAASGLHHLLITGPPGAGKTMIAKRIPGIMPPLDSDESLEVSTIYSISGLLSNSLPYITARPFQSPHHTTTRIALAGGGRQSVPGIISLSHRGVLFLDEFPEFSRDCLEVLREPLEDRKIQISRVGRSYTYPADFMLVAAANPCPCGHFPNRNICNCTEPMIARYRSRVSGPIRDRIDIIVTAEVVNADMLIKPSMRGADNNMTTASMRERVIKAHEIQKKRFENSPLKYNSDITVSMIDKYCHLGKSESEYMKDMYNSMKLTARSYHKILKVARTIADLAGSEAILTEHLSEAVCYRG